MLVLLVKCPLQSVVGDEVTLSYVWFTDVFVWDVSGSSTVMLQYISRSCIRNLTGEKSCESVNKTPFLS